MKTAGFSVLMSLYYKEKPEYFAECMQSILRQSVMPDEVVIVKDGPLTDELEKTLNEYQRNYKKLIKIVELEKNVGLGPALAAGIFECSNELIARMDTDDISREDRFELQLKEFEKNPELDICGSHIWEFDGKVENIVSLRKVPLNQSEIIKYQKKRSAFNHVTVMYKKSAVLRAGNYMDAPLMEDDCLWAKMILAGVKGKNIDDYLVYVRTGQEMIERRGGTDYLKKYIDGRKKLLKMGFIGLSDYYITCAVQLVVAHMPLGIRSSFFVRVLRNRIKQEDMRKIIGGGVSR